MDLHAAGASAAGRPWEPIPGPLNRVSFFDEQRRNRRATWRLSALCVLAVLLMGVPLSLVLTPLLYILLLIGLHLANLFWHIPADVWQVLEQIAFFLKTVIDHLSDGTPLPSPEALLWVAVAALLPGMAALFVLWLGVRALLAGSGVGGILLTLGARAPRHDDLKEKQLVDVVEEMAIAAGAHTPGVMLLDVPVANAAAVGSSPRNATLLFSRLLLDELERDELQAVAGHLIGSVGNGDLHVATTLLSVFQTFGLLDTLINAPFGSEARSALWRLLKVGFRHGHGDPASAAAAVNDLFSRSMMRKSKSDLERLMDREAEKRGFFHSLFQMIVLPIYFFSFSFKLTQWFFTSLFFEPAAAWMWRTRRYLADATSVQLTRNPDALARGLQRLGGFAGLVPCGAWSAPLFFAGNDSGESLSRAEVEKRFEELRRRGFKLPTLDQLEAGRPEALEAFAALSAQFAAAREESGDDSAGGFVSFHPPMKRRLKRLAAQGARWAASGTQRTAKERTKILVAALVLAPILGLVALLLLVAVALCIGLNLVFLGVAMGVILILFRLLPR